MYLKKKKKKSEGHHCATFNPVVCPAETQDKYMMQHLLKSSSPLRYGWVLLLPKLISQTKSSLEDSKNGNAVSIILVL